MKELLYRTVVQMGELQKNLDLILAGDAGDMPDKRFLSKAAALNLKLRLAREHVAKAKFGPVAITLGRSDGIAKFFAFSFVSDDKRPLSDVQRAQFNGSGVYAIYYHGNGEPAYGPISGTETPIYVGKADPSDPFAETLEDQGPAIAKRLAEHAKNIARTNLSLADFSYRAAAIQTGMQAAVEGFMIHLFRPIWNREVKICFGIGKHGDSAQTRTNRRSPWDTMHPGRHWAADTTKDQMTRSDIVAKIADHFGKHLPIVDKDALLRHLALG